MDEDHDELFNLSICAKDVYDLAADIALEFENVADSCGPDLIRTLVNKVVSVLEHLENAIIKFNSISDYLAQLKHQIHVLKTRRIVNAENKNKLEQDFAVIEDRWIEELKELKNTVSHLQANNKQLQNLLQNHLCCQKSDNVDRSDELAVQELRNVISSLNYKLKEKDSILEKHVFEMSSLNIVIEKQAEVNQSLHFRLSESQTEVKHLWQDKQDLKMKVTKQEECINELEKQLKESAVQRMDIEENIPHQSVMSQLDEQFIYDESLKYYKQERELFLTKINELQQELITVQKEKESVQMKPKETSIPRHQPRHKTGRAPAVRDLFCSFRDWDIKHNQAFRYQR